MKKNKCGHSFTATKSEYRIQCSLMIRIQSALPPVPVSKTPVQLNMAAKWRVSSVGKAWLSMVLSDWGYAVVTAGTVLLLAPGCGLDKARDPATVWGISDMNSRVHSGCYITSSSLGNLCEDDFRRLWPQSESALSLSASTSPAPNAGLFCAWQFKHLPLMCLQGVLFYLIRILYTHSLASKPLGFILSAHILLSTFSCLLIIVNIADIT